MKAFFIIGIAICMSCITVAQEAVEFKLNPEIGKPLPSHMRIKTDIDGPQSVIMDMDMKMDMLPESKENENFLFESFIRSIKVAINVDMITMSFDSDSETPSTDEASQMLGEELCKMIDRKISSVVSERGEMVDIQIPARIATQGLDASRFSNIIPTFPEKPVTPGESWESSADLENQLFTGKLDMVSTYSEERAEGYVIAIEGNILDAEGTEIGTVTGNYILDPESHFPISSTRKTTIEAEGSKIVSEMEIVPVQPLNTEGDK